MLRVLPNASRDGKIVITVDGQPIEAFLGETVATALLAAGLRWLRSSPRAESPRGVFCAMGVCQECVVRIDGRPSTACTTLVREGMLVNLDRRPNAR